MKRIRLTRIALEVQNLPPEEIQKIAEFLSSQVESLDDESVAYGAYAANAIPTEQKVLLGTLPARLLLSYRKRLVKWFEYALMKRARAGGGGSGITKIEKGLAEFVEAIPAALVTLKPLQVSEFVPVNDYLLPERLDAVGTRILNTVLAEARAAGVVPPRGGRVAAEINIPLRQDASGRWFVMSTPATFHVKDRLRSLGFRWNSVAQRWETAKLTRAMETAFGLTPPPPARPVAPPPRQPIVVPVGDAANLAAVEQWFAGWLSQNIDRFTRVFTDYARNAQSSYGLVFSAQNGRVSVKFKRDVDTAAKAVEELRYRYTDKHGREPWLEVMERFVDLVSATSPATIQKLIDRINNLQHSNGLFMEHFPSNVRSWYEGFLNAKYHTPTPDILAGFIPDADLRGLLTEMGRTGNPRHTSWESPDYRNMVKELADVGEVINWRERGYPAYKGSTQIDRFDSRVQNNLNVLRQLDTERERILSTDVGTPQKQQAVTTQARAWVTEQTQAIEDLRQSLEAQRLREIEDPNHAAAWDAIHFPEEFVARFPYAVPGASASFLAPFVARYAAIGFIPR